MVIRDVVTPTREQDGSKVSDMTDIVTDVIFPQSLDADIVTPDGTELFKVRVMYRSGILQGVSMGSVVLGPTGILDDPGVSKEGQTFIVPTPDGVYRLTKRQRGCGCGG